MHTKCLFCGNSIQLIFVHGHYQCPVCKTNALPCCDGDNCDNSFLTANLAKQGQEALLHGKEAAEKAKKASQGK